MPYLLLGSAIAAYGVVVGGLYLIQRQLLFRPDRVRPRLDDLVLLGVREVGLRTTDGLLLSSWYLPPRPGRPVIAYFHGNGGHIGYRAGRLARFAREGYGVLMAEYRGYAGNPGFPTEGGFYTDGATGFTHGFLDANGGQSAIDDPEGLPPNVSEPNQNLLAINDFGQAAGFWMDKNGHEHGFVVEIELSTRTPKKFIEIPPSSFPGAVATQASAINDRDDVCGFWTDGSGNNHGFFGRLGEKLTTFNVTIDGATAASTSPFCCNNQGEVVGSFTDSQGAVHGFVLENNRFHQFDAAGSSQAAAFGVMGTLINGVNDEGDLVGFYSDGTKVNGFVRYSSGL